MNIENAVCTAQQAERLTELGITAPSFHKWYKLKYPANEEEFAKNRANCLVTETGDNLDRFIMHYIDNENAFYHWEEGTHDGGQNHSRCELEGDGFPAFTVAELGKMLPSGFYSTYNDHHGYWHCLFVEVWDEDDEPNARPFAIPGWKITAEVDDEEMQTEAQVRAALLVHLLESNLTTAEEINNRLKQ
jgi:hypothetical protein